MAQGTTPKRPRTNNRRRRSAEQLLVASAVLSAPQVSSAQDGPQTGVTANVGSRIRFDRHASKSLRRHLRRGTKSVDHTSPVTTLMEKSLFQLLLPMHTTQAGEQSVTNWACMLRHWNLIAKANTRIASPAHIVDFKMISHLKDHDKLIAKERQARDALLQVVPLHVVQAVAILPSLPQPTNMPRLSPTNVLLSGIPTSAMLQPHQELQSHVHASAVPTALLAHAQPTVVPMSPLAGVAAVQYARPPRPPESAPTTMKEKYRQKAHAQKTLLATKGHATPHVAPSSSAEPMQPTTTHSMHGAVGMTITPHVAQYGATHMGAMHGYTPTIPQVGVDPASMLHANVLSGSSPFTFPPSMPTGLALGLWNVPTGTMYAGSSLQAVPAATTQVHGVDGIPPVVQGNPGGKGVDKVCRHCSHPRKLQPGAHARRHKGQKDPATGEVLAFCQFACALCGLDMDKHPEPACVPPDVRRR